ncbi:hypothetical protein OF385_07190 [Glutamicibacter sp. JL.03c]|uniref:hypothetical protein n=1 Tax=Glutamicibacter sp. JL.03c TaxID=2984842 RepID=UPI0021F7A2B5|nr:hypothetical protein [Glutamicibacter sp. JL.03c]UYQ78915.1 hypothetical protein OF385_07190 [Glutamicibacter sp. JL.03c]
MNFNARTSRTPLALASTALMASLLLTGCGQGTDPDASTSSGSESSNATQPSENKSESAVDQDALLETNDQLSMQLGDAYVQGWIKDGKLHVSTTNEDKLSAIKEAGAEGHVVQYSNKELRSAIRKIMKWQAQQPNPVRSSIHAYSLNPETGGITLSVDKSQIDAITKLIEKDKPMGDIPVDFKPSGGIASPANS